jgi:hypothetical protein
MDKRSFKYNENDLELTKNHEENEIVIYVIYTCKKINKRVLHNHYFRFFPTGGLHDTKKFPPSGSLVRIVNLGYIVHIGVI